MILSHKDVQYDVNQDLMKLDKVESGIVIDISEAPNTGTPSDEFISEWSDATDCENSEFDFQHLEGIQMNNEDQFQNKSYFDTSYSFSYD